MGALAIRHRRLGVAAALGASDDFNRADASTLGTSSSGAIWTARGGVWGILSNTARVVTTGGNRNVATVDSGLTACTITAKLVDTSTSFFSGIAFRYVDMNNYLFVGTGGSGLGTTLRVFVAGGSTTLASAAGTTWAANDVVGIVLSGSSITVTKNGTSVLSSSSSSHTSSTLHGLYNDTSSTRRLDDFAVVP